MTLVCSTSTSRIACSIKEATFHPIFNDEDADVILSSKDGTLFCLPCFTLIKTSRYFRSLLSISQPQSSSGEHDSTPPIHTIPFPDPPLERVLLMISGLPTSPYSSFDEIEAAADVMQHLDTPGPLSVLRASCFAPLFLDQPIRLYGLGTRFGWDEVTQRAAELSLSINLLSPSNYLEIESQMSQLSAPALFKLFKLRRQRRDDFRASLLSVLSAKVRCQGCKRHNAPDASWRPLVLRLTLELENDSSGKSILESEMRGWEELTPFLEAKCQYCYAGFWPKEGSWKMIKGCLEKLPKTV